MDRDRNLENSIRQQIKRLTGYKLAGQETVSEINAHGQLETFKIDDLLEKYQEMLRRFEEEWV